MRSFQFNRPRAAGALLVALVLSAGTARAQRPDPRWQPWLGCWSESGASRSLTAASALVCVVPAEAGAGVELAVVANGKLVSSEAIKSTGQREPKTLEKCPGWESATWSTDDRRLMLRSEYNCGTIPVKGSSVFSISSDGDWIEVRGTMVGVNSTVRAIRYRPAGFTLERTAAAARSESVPFNVVPEQDSRARYSRMSVGANVSADAVLDVVRHVDQPVAEAWLNELRQGFTLDGKELVRLADAGMPSSMIDLMVAVSYPQRFAIRRVEPVQGATGGGVGGYNVDPNFYPSQRYGGALNCGYGYQPYMYGLYGDNCNPGYYGYGAYGYGTGYGNGYYSPYGGYYYGPRPIIIVPNTPGTTTDQRGQAVKGQGYTRRPDGGTATPTGTPGSYTSPSSSGGGSSGSSTSGSSSGSTGSSSGGDRTAKPRVPPL